MVRSRKNTTTLKRLTHWMVILLVLAPFALTFLYRYVPPPLTPLMVIRLIEGDGLDRDWVRLSRLPAHVPLAVMAAEDNRFCRHVGFDHVEIAKAVRDWRQGKNLRGASTLSMQVTRNLFLWPGGGWIRKGLEAVWTPMIELVLGKRRIMELYLNVAEMGRGVFGVEVAAQTHFGKPAAELSRAQAAQLVAILPNPRQWRPRPASKFIGDRAATIQRRMDDIRPLAGCLGLAPG